MFVAQASVSGLTRTSEVEYNRMDNTDSSEKSTLVKRYRRRTNRFQANGAGRSKPETSKAIISPSKAACRVSVDKDVQAEFLEKFGLQRVRPALWLKDMNLLLNIMGTTNMSCTTSARSVIILSEDQMIKESEDYVYIPPKRSHQNQENNASHK